MEELLFNLYLYLPEVLRISEVNSCPACAKETSCPEQKYYKSKIDIKPPNNIIKK